MKKLSSMLPLLNFLSLSFSNIGPRSYFLRGRLAELEQSLIQHMSTQLRNHGYVQMVGPDMFKSTVVVRKTKYELKQYKTNRITCAPSDDADQPGHCSCAQADLSLLGAHVILLVLSCSSLTNSSYRN